MGVTELIFEIFAHKAKFESVLTGYTVVVVFDRYRVVSIGNHMISSAIWDKSARVNFSKTNKIARARRTSAICSL